MRFTVAPDVKDELLDWLLELNHERYAAEVAAGLHDKKIGKAPVKRNAKAGNPGLGGSTLADSQYQDLDGESGNYQYQHRVYGRAGASCMTCGSARIAQTVVAGRTTCYCPKCQR
jgi:formamidopyrimidine-DNA glycosylase